MSLLSEHRKVALRLLFSSHIFLQLWSVNIDPFLVEKYLSIVGNEVDSKCLNEYVGTSSESRKSFLEKVPSRNAASNSEDILTPRMGFVCSNVAVVGDREEMVCTCQPQLPIGPTSDIWRMCVNSWMHPHSPASTCEFF